MQQLVVRARFHAAHRLRDIPGICRFVHGATWRGTIVVAADELPRTPDGHTLSAGALAPLLEQLDHRLIAAGDDCGALIELFGTAGVIPVRGRAPTLENVCHEVTDHVVALLRATTTGRAARYRVEVTIEEGGNGFTVTRRILVRPHRPGPA